MRNNPPRYSLSDSPLLYLREQLSLWAISLWAISLWALSLSLLFISIVGDTTVAQATPKDKVDCSSLNAALKSAQHKPKYKYRRARKLMFTKVEPAAEEGEIVTLYTGQRRAARRSKAPQGLNCEHLFPRAWMGGKRSRHYKYIEADLHNLFPTEIKVNSRRGHLPFEEVSGHHSYRIGLDSKIGLSSEGEEVIEPRPQVRGDIARALLYMALRWELPLNKYQPLEVLKRWSSLDTPSQREEARDDLIYQQQGNRNPFVSCPNLVNEAISVISRHGRSGRSDLSTPSSQNQAPQDQVQLGYSWLKESDKSVERLSDRIFPPSGAQRVKSSPASFAHWLRNIPLLPQGSEVLLYDGQQKSYQGAHYAVLDIDIGERDLQQCADAAIRLRAEYLYARLHQGLKPRIPISFNYTTGDKIPYDRWRRGDRPKVEEYKKRGKRRWRVKWKRRRAKTDKSYQQFRRYLNNIFSYAGTASLSQELSRRSPHDIHIGDLYLRGGFPGHAVIVMDLARHPKHGLVMLLAQSYMPAQSPHLLKNLEDPSLSPWYKVPRRGQLITPEWTFSATNLYRFKGRDQD